MSSSIAFEDIRTGLREIPYGSAVDEAVTWLKSKGLDQTSLINAEHGFDLSKDAFKHTAMRIGVALALPLIAQVGAYYNFVCGSARLVSGIVSHLRHHEQKEISQEFEAAFAHYTTGVYDFAIGYLLNLKHVGTVLTLGLALLPHLSLKGHEMVFSKSDSTHLKDECWASQAGKIVAKALAPEKGKQTFWQKLFGSKPKES